MRWRQVVGNKRYLISSCGKVWDTKGKRFMAQSVSRGYSYVKLYPDSWKSSDGDIRKGKQVHRLVASAFIPNSELKPEVNHLDGNPLNNNVLNLEWVTREENIKHSWLLGRRSAEGIRNSRAILTEDNVKEILSLKGVGIHQREISEKYNCSRSQISAIWTGRVWSHITN